MKKILLTLALCALAATLRAQSVSVPNGAAGTGQNLLAKLQTSGATSFAVTAGTGDTSGVLGICVSGCNTVNTATIVVAGPASCIFDGAVTAGDYFIPSASAAGLCHDAGATYPGSGQILGRVLASNTSASGGLYPVILVDEADAALGVVRVSGSDFTDASATGLQAITGLSWTLPANTATNLPFHCELLYSQAGAAVADTFGIQDVSVSPTNLMVKAAVATSAAAVVFANSPTITNTTATSFVTFTPSAITTVWNASISGFIEHPANSAPSVLQLMVSQGTAADLITVKRGSYCVLGN